MVIKICKDNNDLDFSIHVPIANPVMFPYSHFDPISNSLAAVQYSFQERYILLLLLLQVLFIYSTQKGIYE